MVEPALPTMAFTVNDWVAPLSRVPAVHVTTGAANADPADAEANDVFAGMESDTVTPVAVAGPCF